MRKAALLVALIVLVSCNSSTHFVSYESIPNGWSQSDKISFTVTETPLVPSNIFIHVRNTNDYSYSNLFLIAELRDSIQVISRDTLEYAMADAQGNWLGKGFSEVKESKLYWKENWVPNKKGPYFIDLSQRVRNNGSVDGVSSLEGIISVGIGIEPQTQP